MRQVEAQKAGEIPQMVFPGEGELEHLIHVPVQITQVQKDCSGDHQQKYSMFASKKTYDIR